MRSSSPCAVLCALTWSTLATAQVEAERPEEPAVTAVEPATAPPSPTSPSPEPAAPAPPAADSFPPPPAPTPAPPPRTAFTETETPPPPAEEGRPKPSEGLFQSRPAEVHHADERARGDGVDQFKIGPVVGTGVPSVISVGGTLKVTRFLGAGVTLGLIPKVRLSYYGDATLSYQHVDIYGRIYPFGGGFFLHGGLGYANVNGTLTGAQTYSQAGQSGRVDYQGVGKVHTPTLTALIGYFYTTSIGFSFGVDAGAQIPIAPSTVAFSSSYSVSPRALEPFVGSEADAYAARADQSVRDTLEKIGRTTIPTVNFRVGFIL